MDEQQQQPGAITVNRSEESIAKATLARFILEFTKSISLTGYYPSDHPAIRNVAIRPFSVLDKLRPLAPEVGFVTIPGGQSEETLVEGVLEEPIPFLGIMQSTMGETFARKFAAYLDRNHLVSIHIKTSISLEEFQRFVALLVEDQTREQEGKAEFGSFVDHLVERRIFSVSGITREEMVGTGRALPWRVKVAISRLQKDLAIVPLYSEASLLQLQDAKNEIIRDIIRPLRKPRFIRELLANVDLIEEEVQELSSSEIEMQIIRALEPRMVEEVVWEIVTVLEKARWGKVIEQDGNDERRLDLVLKDVLKNLALRLVELDKSQTYDMLQQLFVRQILEFKDLPTKLQQKMLAEKWTNQFLEHDREVLQAFRTLTDPEEYRRFIKNLAFVLPELLERSKVAHFASLTATLATHAEDDRHPARKEMAREALIRTAEKESLDQLVSLAQVDERTVRTHAMQVLVQLSTPGIVVLLELLASSPSTVVRRDALGFLQRTGELLHPELLEALGRRGQQWYVYRNLIQLAGRTRCEEATGEIRKFLTFWDHRVREEAASALFDLMGCKAAVHIEKLTQDEDWRVVRRAVVLLSDSNCRSRAFLERLWELVSTPQFKESLRGQDAIVTAALVAITKAGNYTLADGVPVSEKLLTLVVENRLGVLSILLKGKRTKLPDTLRKDICSTLGAIGDRSTADAMLRAAREASGELEEWLRAAVEDLYARINVEQTQWKAPSPPENDPEL